MSNDLHNVASFRISIHFIFEVIIFNIHVNNISHVQVNVKGLPNFLFPHAERPIKGLDRFPKRRKNHISDKKTILNRVGDD